MIRSSALRSRFSRRAILAAGALAAATSVASADALLLGKHTCTTLNCGALSLPGIINGHPTTPPSAAQWVGQFSSQSASCLRFQVVSASQSRDLAMSVVAPDGTVFTDNNGGVTPCTTCPKVVVATAKNGYYTVIIAHAAGLPATETTFSLRAGLYNTGNLPNCGSPTAGK
jgi:hypothetical protein